MHITLELIINAHKQFHMNMVNWNVQVYAV